MMGKNLLKTELIPLAAGLLIIAASIVASGLKGGDYEPGHLRCAIQMSSMDDTTGGLLTGYNYHLLESFASESGSTIDITLSRRGDSYVDSLKSGSIDLVAVPLADATVVDSVEMSIPVDGISAWLLPRGSVKLKEALDKWIHSYHHSEGYKHTRTVFLKTYDPFRVARSGRKLSYISPYDSLVRRYADSLGWDWKLLSAVIYQESRFKIDARSHRGAIGLMQMMPFTAERWADGDVVNPERSIKAGTMYLKSLQSRYFRVSDTPLERQKITLAAYNAGEGRIRDVLNYARELGVHTGCWDSLARVIPLMSDPEAMAKTDTVKLGSFKGTETVAYVDRVMELYGAFKTLYREPENGSR